MKEKERTFESERDFFFSPPQSSASVRGKRWSEVSGLGSKKRWIGIGGWGGGVNSTWGELGEENINRACGVEAACHGPLPEKD